MVDVKEENQKMDFKILVQNEEVFKTYLEQHTILQKEEALEDTYFEHPDYPFLYIDEKGLKNAKKWLRVRKSDKGDTVNFKKRGVTVPSEMEPVTEIETKVESGEQMIKILEALGFVISFHYHKIRKVYEKQDFEFIVDFIDLLGMVVKIEYHGAIDTLKNGIEKIKNFLHDIGITDYIEIKTNYPQILWNGIDCYL